MQKTGRRQGCSSMTLFLGLVLWLLPQVSWADGVASGIAGQPAPHVILSAEFFRAMEKLAGSGIVTGDRQENLLEQIALSQKFLVKTNLALMEQNERLIRLLEEINRKLSKGGP